MTFPFDYLFIEFPTKTLISTTARLRFKVMQRPDRTKSELAIRILKKGDLLYGNKKGRKSAQNIIYIDPYIPRKLFEETVKDFISQRYHTSKDAIKLKWEKGNIAKLLREEN